MIKQISRECNKDSLHFFQSRILPIEEKNVICCQFVFFTCSPLISKISTKPQLSFPSFSQAFYTHRSWILSLSGKFLNKDLQCLVYLAWSHVGKCYKAQEILILVNRSERLVSVRQVGKFKSIAVIRDFLGRPCLPVVKYVSPN